MKIKIHKGNSIIAGSAVEIISDKSRILIDTSTPLTTSSTTNIDKTILFSNSAKKLFKQGILYPIDGLYDFQKPQFDAVLISHSHKYHFGFYRHIHPKIPVFLNENASKLINIYNKFDKESKIEIHNLRTIVNWVNMEINELIIKPYLIDNSGYNSLAYYIKHRDTKKSLFYSGNFYPETWDNKLFNNFLNNHPSVAECLLLENDIIDRENGDYPDEQTVCEKIKKIINASDNKYIFVFCPLQNVNRLISLYKAVKSTYSTFIIDIYTACILDALHNQYNDIPQYSSQNVRVFFADSYHKNNTDKYAAVIEKAGMAYLLQEFVRRKISLEQLKTPDNKVVVLIQKSMLPMIEKLPGIAGSTLIFSSKEGYIDSRDNKSKYFWDFMLKNKISVEPVHTDSSAAIAKLKKVIAAINPDVIIPVHCTDQAKFSSSFQKVKFLNTGEEHTV